MEFLVLIGFMGVFASLIGFLIQLFRKKQNKKKWLMALAVFVVLFVIGSISSTPTPPKELTNIGEYDSCRLELQDATVITNEQGRFLKVNAVYTNSKQTPQYGSSAFAVRAFQNDTELNDWSFSQEDTGNLATEVRNGASVNVSFLFELADNTEVEVLIGTPTADMETIGKTIYLKAEE